MTAARRRILLGAVVVAAGAALAATLVATGVIGGTKRRSPPDAANEGAVVLVAHDAAPTSPSSVLTSRRLRVEVSAKLDDRRRGLSGRASLAEDAGMLFVYGADQERNFWMKDCLIPLDIAYLDVNGRILRILTVPPDPGTGPDDVPRAPSGVPCRFVLEANAGWFARRGIAAGEFVDVGAVAAGVVPD